MKVDPYLFWRGMCSQIWDWQRGVLLIVCSSCLCRVSLHEEIEDKEVDYWAVSSTCCRHVITRKGSFSSLKPPAEHSCVCMCCVRVCVCTHMQ